MPSILGANSVSGYNITNSLRFDDGSGTRLLLSPGQAGNRRIWTWSAWVKRSVLDNRGVLWHINGSGDTEILEFIFHQNNYIMLGLASVNIIETTNLFMDPSAWYHLVLAVDTTQGTDTNRIKLYVNGVQNTEWDETNYPNQNADLGIGQSGVNHAIGATATGGNPFDGYMTHINYVDGLQLAASNFGEFNSDGVWIPKEPDVSDYGDNGFFIEAKQTGTNQNSSGMGADTSGKDNHMGVTNMGSNHSATDSPTNNFCTMNDAAKYSTGVTLKEGGLFVCGNASDAHIRGTFPIQGGKWYWEAKCPTAGSGSDRLGIIFDDGSAGVNIVSPTNNVYGVQSNGASNNMNSYTDGTFSNNNSLQGFGNNAIVQFAYDYDAGKLFVGIDNTYKNLSNTASDVDAGTNPTFSSIPTNVIVTPYVEQRTGSATSGSTYMNFGNPAVTLTSAVSGEGGGSFEYDPPTGYKTLCTKNLGTNS